ncbi:ral guanine nucleotide dissociation stimulator-like isoform X1 [Equus caballus]|uniref:ral guanine nucleotide dissociation stimulator-like isoform X1 n=1 Tax=Equus caballus TaxID=9796 RepID=UPI0038B39B65
MFTCCVPVFRGSRLRKTQSVRLLCCCGHRIKPHGQFGRRYPKNSTQEIFEELHDGFDFSPSLVKGQEQQAASSILCRSENSTQEIFEELCVGFDFSPSLVKEQEQQATSSILCRSEEPTLSVAEARTMLTLKAGAVQKVVGCLQPSFHGRSISVTTFPCVYQAFYPTPQVLDQLLQSALSPIWGPRPQENSQDMWQMLRHSRINLTLAYLQDLLPGSVLKHQATPLLIQVDLFQATELETEAPAPAPALLPGAEVEKGPHLELDGTPVLFLPSLLALEPAAAPSAAPDPERVPSAAPAQVPGPELDSTGPRGLLGFPPQAPVTAAESAPVPEASHPCRVTGKKQPDGKPSLMAFSPRDVAEQLTAIDAEVFKNVEPSECLGSTWGKRNRPGHENVAPTVWATVVQFNRVVKCVMTSCLGDPNVTARGRAKVLERWIEVARECRALRNISSLHAVLSALQSVPIHRLKKTWGKVSRKSCRKFKKLCDEDNSLSWELLIKKQPSKFATLLRTLQRGRKRQQQKGIVPFLGTMLTDLIMLDTAMEDYVNGNEINHEKKKKEHSVMIEIVQLQEAAENYNLEPQELFRSWFWDMEQLSEDERMVTSRMEIVLLVTIGPTLADQALGAVLGEVKAVLGAHV